MAAKEKMPIRKRKTPVRLTRLKTRRAMRERAAARRSIALLALPRNIISLANYRGTHAAQPDIAVGDGLDRHVPLPKGHSAQIILFTGVQIVRDISND